VCVLVPLLCYTAVRVSVVIGRAACMIPVGDLHDSCATPVGFLHDTCAVCRAIVMLCCRAIVMMRCCDDVRYYVRYGTIRT